MRRECTQKLQRTLLNFKQLHTIEKSTSCYFCRCGDVDAGGGGCRCANNTGLFWAVRRSGAKGLTSLPRSWNHTATTSYMTWQGMLSQPQQL